MNRDPVLAFRLARSGLARREPDSLTAAVACPASDFARDGALLAIGARVEKVSRVAYDEATDAGEVAVAHVLRGAIHALASDDLELYGRTLLADDDRELGHQLGHQVRRLGEEHGLSICDALEEVSEAARDALNRGGALSKGDLHQALRERVRPELMPWCRSCGSHHVAPMLWRYGTIKAGASLDSARRYRLIESNAQATPPAEEAVRRFLRFYGPATPSDFGEWAGLSKSHAKRLWNAIADELTETRIGNEQKRAWLLTEDEDELEAPPAAEGVRLLPPGDPYLQKPNRPLLAPDATLRTRLFRPVASPGAVLRDGRLVALWRAKAKGKDLELTIEALRPLPRDLFGDEAERLAALRGARAAILVL